MTGRPKRAPKLSRRRFVTLLAAGSAAALAAPVAALAASTAPAKAVAHAKTSPPPSAAPAPPGNAALRAEVEKQKKALADQLKVIRDYHLPPGSNMAFVFQPVRRKGRTP
jgi:hypothetical protein